MEECLICKEIFESDSNVEKHLEECIPLFFNKELRVHHFRTSAGILLLQAFDGKYLYGLMNGYDVVFDITDTAYSFSFKGSIKEFKQILKMG